MTSGYVGSGRALCAASYVFTFVIDDPILGDVTLDPMRGDHVPGAACNAFPETLVADMIGCEWTNRGIGKRQCILRDGTDVIQR